MTLEGITDAGDEISLNLFKKYEVGKLLGCGAFAKVYHGRDLRSGRSVAIKAISKQRVMRKNLVAHIKREISIMHKLDHPHIVRLVEVLATKTKIYFVMEFAKGGELFTKVAKGRFSEDLSRKYFRQLISAVGFCHSLGIYHRDLKPENLLLDENWDLKITDFGLSAVADQIRPDGLLHTLCGTPAYVAPEILAKQGYDGGKIDVWSCGVILFVLNAGYLPFNDTNLMAMYRKIYRGEFRCPKWTSPELKYLLSRILDPNPASRITLQEILLDPWFQKGEEIAETKPPPPIKESLSGDNHHQESPRFLNAFDLISYSSGTDLSGLFSGIGDPVSSEMFVSAETPEKIIQRIEEAAEGMRVVKKGMVLKLSQPGKKNVNCNCELTVGVRRLTEELVVVDVTIGGSEGGDIWYDRLKPRLTDLIHQSEESISGDTHSSSHLLGESNH